MSAVRLADSRRETRLEIGPSGGVAGSVEATRAPVDLRAGGTAHVCDLLDLADRLAADAGFRPTGSLRSRSPGGWHATPYGSMAVDPDVA
jgi:hypothetical protein